ncbi:cyclic nucleotide-binding domain protein (macronuclear) [Tetrahymena thermophila SB210]|uniref:Cyclic nucleotide-binding domain protein n=1 Tax=Tetrahymena thermophila (strain SB210) TaxID=312017 RepID=Q239J0_TETTS|nr:cyclic nucleotide-binding domain protein [Tetrahymena thermophila SB210]EAR93200.2 cyclic nucleotide-binding domain protein [Tetrahymena thermophila SB210]|eukprot:XP_001013445.2 cyclic nucleotide-binding domain protein [Tetrahymena thermophila SB210]
MVSQQKVNKGKQGKKEEDEKKQKNQINYLTQEKRNIGQQMLSKFLENDYNLEVATQQQKLCCLLVILEKKPEDRTQKEVKILARLTENIKFFKEVRLSENGSSIHEQLCKYLIPRSFEANKTLFNQGDHGDEFWIILTGEVKVLKREFVETVSSNEQLNSERESKSKQSNSLPTESSQENNGPIQGEFQTVEKVRLAPGNCFGELALVSEGETRKATVQTTMDSEFAVVMKDDFLRIIKVISQNSVFIEKFASMSLLNQLNYNQVKQLYDICYEKEFRHNNIVYSEGDTPEEVYFIKSGEFSEKILKKEEYKYEICQSNNDQLSVTNQQNVQQNKQSGNNIKVNSNSRKKDEQLNLLITAQDPQSQDSSKKSKLQNQLSKQQLEKASEQHLQISEDVILGELMLYKNKKVKSKKLNPLTDHMKSDQFITLKIMSIGQCFGEEELILKKNREYKRVTTVICTSDSGSLYCFNKKDFLKKFYNDDIIYKIFASQLQVKREQRTNQLQKFSDTHNSHAKIFEIQSNIIRVVRNCDLVEDFDEKEHCFIKPQRLNFKSLSSTLYQTQQANSQQQQQLVQQQQSSQMNSSSLTSSSNGQSSPIVEEYTKSIRKGQTDNLVIEEVYQSGNENNTGSNSQKIAGKPVERNTMQILQQSTSYNNKKSYMGTVRKSQGIIILQQEYLKQFYEKYNIPEQDLYQKDLTSSFKKSKQIQDHILDGSQTNRSNLENGNHFLVRMNELKKDQQQNLFSYLRKQQQSYDSSTQAIIVNSPLNNSKHDLPLTQNAMSQFNPQTISSFKEYIANLHDQPVLNKLNGQLKNTEQSSMSQRRNKQQKKSFQSDIDCQRRVSDIINVNSDKIQTPKLNLNSQKISLSYAGSVAEQLTDREKEHKRRLSQDTNPLSQSEMFNHKEGIKKQFSYNQKMSNLSQALQRNYKDHQSEQQSQNLLINTFKNTFYSQKAQFEQNSPNGRMFSSSYGNFSGLIKPSSSLQSTKYYNPLVLKVHQDFIDKQKNEIPTATLHSKSLQKQNSGSISSILTNLKLSKHLNTNNNNNPFHSQENYIQSSSRTELSSSALNKYPKQIYQDSEKTEKDKFNIFRIPIQTPQKKSEPQNVNSQKKIENQTYTNYFSTPSKEVKTKQQIKKNLDVNMLPLKYKLNLIVQNKDHHKITQGKIKKNMPQLQALGILQSSGIHLQDRQKLSNNNFTSNNSSNHQFFEQNS